MAIPQRPTRAEIDLGVLASNFQASKAFIGSDLSYMAVVKADAYGHGSVKCARRLETSGIDWFGVAIPEEGIELRKGGIKNPILCLGSYWPGQEALIIENDLTPVIFCPQTAAELAQYASSNGRTVDIHVKIDTGMGRVGARFESCGEFADTLAGLPNVRVSGLMTHLAAADAHREDSFTDLQIERFNDACAIFRQAGHDPEWIHIANSPGAIGHPYSRGNLVRLGGALYGLLDDILEPNAPRPELKPVLSLVSAIADVKDMQAGESLGYGRTFITARHSRIALVPVGYADGYPRGLSNNGHACVRGTKAPVVGRISMDWTMLDVTDIADAAVGDAVTLIGYDGGCRITAPDLARAVDTIGYEITCGIGPRARRVFV